MEGEKSKPLEMILDILSRHKNLRIVFQPGDPLIGEALRIRFHDLDLNKCVERVIYLNVDIKLFDDSDAILCVIMDDMEDALYERNE